MDNQAKAMSSDTAFSIWNAANDDDTAARPVDILSARLPELYIIVSISLAISSMKCAAYFQASYIQADLYQHSSSCLCDLGSESVSLDSAREGSLE